jgi:hypothetical protein
MVLWQLLSDASCTATVAMAIVYCKTAGVKIHGVDTGGYVRARNNILFLVYKDIAQHVARELEIRAPHSCKPFERSI